MFICVAVFCSVGSFPGVRDINKRARGGIIQVMKRIYGMPR